MERIIHIRNERGGWLCGAPHGSVTYSISLREKEVIDKQDKKGWKKQGFSLCHICFGDKLPLYQLAGAL